MGHVIEVDGLGKRYRLGEHHGAGGDLRETVSSLVARLRGRDTPEPAEFWSLRDVSFSVSEGEAIGIVGANGAGKSTLLKVINNITSPTEGECRTRGRIGSLLEVGTGFHRELTGRENTFLNGAILGMSRREVARRLDEIVDFAGLEAFMDTPVKRYSSGMYLRLGFAIAAHLDADILLVDEVLAVGDADFQRRCLGKMSEIGESGRTVVFISHNMDAIRRLCGRAVWLEQGRVEAIGDASTIVEEYTRASLATTERFTIERDEGKDAQVVSLALVDVDGRSVASINTWTESWIQAEVAVTSPTPGLDVGVQVSTVAGLHLFDEYVSEFGQLDISRIGTHRLRCRLPPMLAPGEYTLGVWLGTAYEEFEQYEHAVSFRVEGEDEVSGRRLLRLGAQWDVERTDATTPEPTI